jgi:hypothetical protein
MSRFGKFAQHLNPVAKPSYVSLCRGRVIFDNIADPTRSASARAAQRQKVPALKAAIEDLKAGRLQAGWEKLEHFGVIKEVVDDVELRQRAEEQHLEALRAGKTSLMISPLHEEARKVAAVVRQKLKAEGAIGGGGSRGHRSAPHGSRVRSVPGSLTLRAWPGNRIPQPDRGRVSAWREVYRERNELRDRDAGEQWDGPSVQTIC